MKRRDILVGAAGLVATGHSSGLACESGLEDWRQAFRTAMESHPWLRVFRSAEHEDYQTQTKLHGAWPSSLTGVLYRSGPAGHEVGGMRYHHWFDGDGMVQSWRIEGGQLQHRARLMNTVKRTQESTAGRMLYNGFGTAVPGAENANPDSSNTGNINTIVLGGELLSLWEAGSALRLNRETLDFEAFKVFSEGTEGLPFSAHPRIDPTDGTLWNIGVAPWLGAMVVYRIDAEGALQNTAVFRLANLGMVHDFLITQRHIIVPLPPFVLNRENLHRSYLDAHTWQAGLGTRVLVIDKNSLEIVKRTTLPAGWIFHYGNAWEEPDGTFRFDAAWYEDPGVMSTVLRDVMCGHVATRDSSYSTFKLIGLHPDGRTSMETLDGRDIEFPRIHPQDMGLRRTEVVYLWRDRAAHPFFNAVALGEQAYSYGEDVIAEEHLIVGKYILGTSIDWVRNRHRISVFRQDALGDGPLGWAELPYSLPHALHGNFYPLTA